MSLLTNILAIYFTVLSIIPCNDGISHTETNITSEFSQSHSGHNPSDSQDHCTLFCACACCGTMVVMPFVYQLTTSRIDLCSTYKFNYTFDYSFNYNEGVWHPPASS